MRIILFILVRAPSGKKVISKIQVLVPVRASPVPSVVEGVLEGKKERKKTDNPREGWVNGTPPPHRDFKERSVMR